jgi:hypothetical protein
VGQAHALASFAPQDMRLRLMELRALNAVQLKMAVTLGPVPSQPLVLHTVAEAKTTHVRCSLVLCLEP